MAKQDAYTCGECGHKWLKPVGATVEYPYCPRCGTEHQDAAADVTAAAKPRDG